jgi:hypothetical protein
MSKIRLRAIIITQSARYEKDLHHCQMSSPIWKICVETQRQLESEQYLQQKGFRRVK